jgi:hypothetical protein
MKTFVSQAVSVATDPAGKKLMADLNKYWAAALKQFKEYEKVVALAEKQSKQILDNVHNLDPSWLDSVQGMLNYTASQLKPVAVALKNFEKTEEALIKKYPPLKAKLAKAPTN